MVLLLTVSKAQERLKDHMREHRLNLGLTQQGLSDRSGVRLASLRKFEQKGSISLESFLKLAMALGCLEEIVKGAKPVQPEYSSIDDMLKGKQTKIRKKGWKK